LGRSPSRVYDDFVSGPTYNEDDPQYTGSQQLEDLEHRRCGSHRQSWDRTYEADSEARVPFELLRSCRQICSEATPVFWATNTLSFEDADTLKHFMADRTTLQKGWIRKLHLRMSLCCQHRVYPWQQALKMPMIRSLKALKVLHIDIEQDMWPCEGSDGKAVTRQSNFQLVTTFQVLPLECATVVVRNYRLGVRLSKFWLPYYERLKLAQAMRQELMVPHGKELH